MKLKPFYSIQDLADILDVEVYTVADGLVACGVPAFHIGKEIVLAKYDCFKPPRMGGEMYVFTSTRERPAEPEPTTVIVSTAKLPPLWIDYIEKSDLFDGKEEPGIKERTTQPISDCNDLKQEIGGKTFSKLMASIRAYEDKYQGRSPKLDIDVRPWLRSDINCSEREAHVFGAIISEHFNISGGTKKTKQ